MDKRPEKLWDVLHGTDLTALVDIAHQQTPEGYSLYHVQTQKFKDEYILTIILKKDEDVDDVQRI